MRQWRRVFSTDESRFTLYRSDGRRRVYRRRGERYTDACVVERDRFGGGSVCVWGGISYGFKSPLIVIDGNLNGVRYRDEILRPVAVPCVQARNLILSCFAKQEGSSLKGVFFHIISIGNRLKLQQLVPYR